MPSVSSPAAGGGDAPRPARRLSSRRTRVLALCAVPVVSLFAVALLAPLPFSVAQPGMTADVLGSHDGKAVISVSGTETRRTTGQLRMTTIAATGPDADVRFADVVDGWFSTDRAVLPREAVYPVGDTTKEIERYNAKEFRKSQSTATSAALGYLHRSPDDVKVTLRLADVGGPSAGLLFSLGIVDKLDGDGSGGDLTGGRTVAGTGTITPDGKVGAVGGVPLKTQAAKRDGASVFLVPEAECDDAKAELPDGLRLVPVTTLEGAVNALKALDNGGRVPRC
ncbi:S16 family serine protease [Streptomyces sp. NPDC047108]|uniref:YlbL family protein n=1 Tax=Streptomyces sp. NPDC047108 TaxID=3155025 RepID=UPI0033E6CA0C